jgi:hypothetical protein
VIGDTVTAAAAAAAGLVWIQNRSVVGKIHWLARFIGLDWIGCK